MTKLFAAFVHGLSFLTVAFMLACGLLVFIAN